MFHHDVVVCVHWGTPGVWVHYVSPWCCGMRAVGYTRGVGTLCFTIVLWYALINSIDTKRSLLFLLIVSTNAVFKKKKLVAKIKFERKIYPDLFTYVLLRRTFRLCGQSFD